MFLLIPRESEKCRELANGIFLSINVVVEAINVEFKFLPFYVWLLIRLSLTVTWIVFQQRYTRIFIAHEL